MTKEEILKAAIIRIVNESSGEDGTYGIALEALNRVESPHFAHEDWDTLDQESE